MPDSPTYHQFVLENGLRVVILERPGVRRFAATMAVRVGLWDDPSGLDGLSHLVEHLAFAGPGGEQVRGLARRGLILNAATSYHRTYYTGHGHFTLLEPYLESLGKVLENVACDPATIQRELLTLYHEYTARAAMDSAAALFTKRLWGPILGTKRIVKPGWKNMTNLMRQSYKHVQAFHSKHYRSDNTVLALVSPFAPDHIKPLLEKFFPHPSDQRAVDVPVVPGESGKHIVPKLIAFPSRSAQTWVQIYHYYRPLDRYPSPAGAMLSDLLGGGFHSLLFYSIRELNRLAYNVGSQMHFFGDCGIVVAQALVQRKAVYQTGKIFLEQCKELGAREIRDEVFEDAKTRLIHKFEMLEDEWNTLTEFIVLDYTGSAAESLRTPQFYRDQLEALTLPEFTDVARSLFSGENRIMVLSGSVGPFTRWRLKRLMKRL